MVWDGAALEARGSFNGKNCVSENKAVGGVGKEYWEGKFLESKGETRKRVKVDSSERGEGDRCGSGSDSPRYGW